MMSAISRRDFLRGATGGAFTVTGLLGGGWLVVWGPADDTVDCLRPPGALPEDEFLAACIRCGRCADACPNRSIVAFTELAGAEVGSRPGDRQRGTPVILPRRQACMLCNGAAGDMLLCTAACPSGALTPLRKDPETIRAKVRMGTAEVDPHICYSFNGASCGVCVRACPFDGIALKAGLWERPIVDPEVCVGCGLCERSCVHYPQAIRIRPSMTRSA